MLYKSDLCLIKVCNLIQYYIGNVWSRIVDFILSLCDIRMHSIYYARGEMWVL